MVPAKKNPPIKIKIPIRKMAEIVEEAVKNFNNGQRGSRSIHETFRSAGQDLFCNCKAEFEAEAKYC